MASPVSGVKYRIQSVDFLSCLELLNPTATSTTDVRLRPTKETNRQYWQFETVPGYTGCYYVRNVANSNQCLYISSSSVYASEASTAYALVKVTYDNGAYRLAFYYSSSNYYFYTSDNNTVVSVTTSSNSLDAQKWQLVPVTPQPIRNDPLQPGPYRIRSLNGVSLLTMPDGQSIGDTNVYVRSQSDQSPYHRWTVTMLPSGKYTIQNAGNNAYLACGTDSAAVGDGLVGSQTAFQWVLQSVGGFAWSLRIPAPELSVGSADYEIEDDDEVSLVPSDATSSQIWFMEKYTPIGEDKIYAKRELAEGKYLLRSAHDQSIYMNAFSTPWRINPGTATTSKFELKYINDKSARFKLTYVTTTTPAPIVADAGGYIGFSINGTEFVLLEKDKGNPGYVMCRPDSGKPHKVASGRVTSDIDKNNVFAIDNIVPLDALQMWKFVPAT